MGKLKDLAKSVFERYPGVDKVYVTTDGQAFFDEVYAKNHANVRKLEVFTICRSKIDAEAPEQGGGSEIIEAVKLKTAKELIADIEAAETVEIVRAILEAEDNGSKRKSVLEAAAKKIDKLLIQS